MIRKGTQDVFLFFSLDMIRDSAYRPPVLQRTRSAPSVLQRPTRTRPGRGTSPVRVTTTAPQLPPPREAQMTYLQLSDLVDQTDHLTISVEVYASALPVVSPEAMQALAGHVASLSRCVSRLERQYAYLDPSGRSAWLVQTAIEEARAAIARISSS